MAVDWSELVGSGAKKSVWISTVESCTGGYIASGITDVSGASDTFKGGIVAYSNELKMKMAGVVEETLKEYGAVSRECAEELAEGFRERSDTDLCVSVTGIAGPTGGTEEKPVGTVYIGLSVRGGKTFAEGFLLEGLSRSEFKEEVARRALGMLMGGIDSIERSN